jgi:hypothetical protein
MSHDNFAEASKKILQYLAAISPYSSEVERVKDKLLKSNPLLEASAITIELKKSCMYLIFFSQVYILYSVLFVSDNKP